MSDAPLQHLRAARHLTGEIRRLNLDGSGSEPYAIGVRNSGRLRLPPGD